MTWIGDKEGPKEKLGLQKSFAQSQFYPGSLILRRNIVCQKKAKESSPVNRVAKGFLPFTGALGGWWAWVVLLAWSLAFECAL